MDDRYAAAFDQISEKIKVPLVLLGARGEVAEVEKIACRLKRRPHVLAGKISLREMCGIVARASLFVCNDSAPMHIAAALKTPTVAIFGPSKSAQTGPRSPAATVVEKPFACRDRCDEQACMNKIHHECMKSIAVQDVVAAALDLWLRANCF
jgi:ADP-heptose:LPS heptosyltransferase